MTRQAWHRRGDYESIIDEVIDSQVPMISIAPKLISEQSTVLSREINSRLHNVYSSLSSQITLDRGFTQNHVIARRINRTRRPCLGSQPFSKDPD